ncbi:MAG TPA: Thivi_2564 family membrane protein [Planctomycetota bacterium]|nr:Thivi_2564 family membrane protein [Planctomycetota bacterium]
MPLIHLIVVLAIIGVLLWFINTSIPMDGNIKKIINIVALIAVVLYVLQSFGLITGIALR